MHYNCNGIEQVIKNRNNSIMEGQVKFDILVVSSVAVTKTGLALHLIPYLCLHLYL